MKDSEMKNIAILALSVALLPCVLQGQDKTQLTTQKEKVSYSIGLNIGTTWKRQGVEVDLEPLLQGIKDALAGTNPLITEQEAREVTMAFQKELRAKQEEKRKELG